MDRPPIVSDPEHLRRAAGSAYVVIRPSGSLADRFARIQASALRAAPGTPVVPAAHCTLQGFGGPDRPLTRVQVDAIEELVGAWATDAVRGPLRLVADAVDAFGGERVPVIRLRAEPDLRSAIGVLRRRARLAGLPVHDDIPAREWILHLSLAYFGDMDGAAWDPYARRVRALDAGSTECPAAEADLLRYDGGPERTVAVFPLGSSPV